MLRAAASVPNPAGRQFHVCTCASQPRAPWLHVRPWQPGRAQGRLLAAQPSRVGPAALQKARCRGAGGRAWATAVPAGTPGADAAAKVAPTRRASPRLPALLSPFKDTTANAKLLALCAAQALSSVATCIHETYLAVYLSDVLHLSNTKIGNLQGAALFLSKAAGGISGTISDLVSPSRVVLLGAALAAINKPMYAACGTVYATLGATACLYWVTFAKIFDRVSKGIREAPTKSLIGELAAASGDSPAGAFGLRQSFMVLGVALGSGAAALAWKLTKGNYPLTFALSAAPAAAALVLLGAAFGRHRGALPEPEAPAAGVQAGQAVGAIAGLAGESGFAEGTADASGTPLAAKARALLSALRPAYWQALAVVSLLYMARFDVGFASLRARQFIPAARLSLLLVVSAMAQVALAAPIGARVKAGAAVRNSILLAGMAAMIAADLCFAFWPSVPGMLAGALLLGVHLGMTHGVSTSMLASYLPSTVPGLGRVSGTAWSITDMFLGAVLACSNLLAGRLTDLTEAQGLGRTGCFLGGATATALSMAALVLFSLWGDLGREDLLAEAQGKAAPEPAAS